MCRRGVLIDMVNLELYRIFKIVADEENLTKASNLYIQTSPFSPFL